MLSRSPRWLLVAALSLFVAPSASHAHGAGDAVGRAHAKRDGATVSMKVWQRHADSRAGLRPRSALARRAAVGLPSAVGSFGAIQAMPVVPVFVAALPSGKLLMWDSVGDNAAETYADHTYTRAAVYDPVTGTSKRVDVAGGNIFCAGFSHLANGNVLVAGGNADSGLNGLRRTHIFDWRSETWSRGPDMAEGRWYPSVAAQADGSALIVGGGPTIAELYRAGTLRRLSGVVTRSSRLYPFISLNTNGRTLFSDDQMTGDQISIADNGALAGTGDRSRAFGDYGSYAQYAIGKTLFAGGGANSSAAAAVVDTTSGVPVMRDAAPMASRRRHHNLTVLADGSVLSTGGMGAAGNVNLGAAVYEAERFDPATGAWSRMASAQVAREYHSTAILLPDGRVFTGGGGVCGECMNQGYLRKDAEIYTPPYLYAPDGSGQPAQRPQIGAAPSSVSYASRFTVDSPQASTITKVGLVKLGAPTHGEDQDQRYVPLDFRAAGNTLNVGAPANAFDAPPGYYMLFIVNAQGVPSVSAMVRIDRAAPPAEVTAGDNVALGTKATATSSCNSAEGPEKAVNGSVSGGNADKWCSLAANPTLQIDLGQSRQISSVTISHAQAGGETAAWNTRGYVLSASLDGTSWTTLSTVTANTSAVTTDAFAARAARYVRLTVTTPEQTPGGAARIYEVEVRSPTTITPDVPAVAPTQLDVGQQPSANVALAGTATGSGSCNASETPQKAINGSVSGGYADKWCAGGANQWMQVDLGAAKEISKIVVRHAQAGGEPAWLNTRAFTLLTSNDKTNWSTVASVAGNTSAVTTSTFAAQTARYVRLQLSDAGADGAARIYELEIWSTGQRTEQPASGRSYGEVQGAAAVYTQPSYGGAAQRLEAGAHDAGRGNLGPARFGFRSIEIARGYQASICSTSGSCMVLVAGRYPYLPAGYAGALQSVSVTRVA